MTVQKTKHQDSSILIYMVSIIIMALLTQTGFPSMAPDTVIIRIAWSAMAGIPAGWFIAFLIHKLVMIRLL